MSQDEIIAMAKEAGLNSYRIAPCEAVAVWERFAALVAAKERKACAQVCEQTDEDGDGGAWLISVIRTAELDAHTVKWRNRPTVR